MQRRAEAKAFVAGFALCYKAIGQLDSEMLAEVVRLSDALWPPFDPLPEPTKAPRKGMKEPWEAGFFEEQNIALGRGRKPTE